jgi:hypothetical protein
MKFEFEKLPPDQVIIRFFPEQDDPEWLIPLLDDPSTDDDNFRVLCQRVVNKKLGGAWSAVNVIEYDESEYKVIVTVHNDKKGIGN